MRKRNKSILIRMSDEEYAQFEQKRKESGQTTQSYILNSILEGKISSPEEVAALKDRNAILADMDKQLRGMGTNLNQVAHVVNGRGAIPTGAKIKQMYEEISDMRKKVDQEWQSTRLAIAKQRLTQR